MKKIIIISATLEHNYKLAKNIKDILSEMNVEVSLLSLEDYMLPLYTDKVFSEQKDYYKNKVVYLTEEMKTADGLIICGPEYNGSIAPIISNAIAWVSTSTEYWRDSFLNKIALIGTHSGGGGDKFFRAMKTQLEHLGSVVMPRSINVNNSSPLKKDSAKKILKQFINLI
jgi:NAD(P)H-dependent FMN reductase